MIVRFTSFLCIFFSVYFIAKILNKLGSRTDKSFFIITLLHSVVLFPFFYSSQLSTSSTFLWAIGTAYLLLFSRMHLLLFICLLIGPFLRFEAIYYVILCIGSIAAIKYSIEQKLLNVLKIFSKRQYISIAVFIFAYFGICLIIGYFNESFHEPSKVFSVYSSKVPYYPASSHFLYSFIPYYYI